MEKKHNLIDTKGEELYKFTRNKYINIQIDYANIKENNKYFKKKINKNNFNKDKLKKKL